MRFTPKNTWRLIRSSMSYKQAAIKPCIHPHDDVDGTSSFNAVFLSSWEGSTQNVEKLLPCHEPPFSIKTVYSPTIQNIVSPNCFRQPPSKVIQQVRLSHSYKSHRTNLLYVAFILLTLLFFSLCLESPLVYFNQKFESLEIFYHTHLFISFVTFIPSPQHIHHHVQ